MTFNQYSQNNAGIDFRKNVGGYDPRNPLNRWAFSSCAFSRFRKGEKVFLLDAMAGPGKFGKMILDMHKEKKLASNINISFNDVRLEPLQYLKDEGFDVVHSDIRTITIQKMFDIVIERFGLKDLPFDQVPIALEKIRNLLTSTGRIVIADMFATSKASQNEAIAVHAAEQHFAGRNEEQDGTCHIPTIDEWLSVLKSSGFRASVRYARAKGDIELSMYKGRFSQNPQDVGMIDYLNSAIVESCSKNSSFARDYLVSLANSNEKTKISWPYLVIVGEKA